MLSTFTHRTLKSGAQWTFRWMGHHYHHHHHHHHHYRLRRCHRHHCHLYHGQLQKNMDLIPPFRPKPWTYLFVWTKTWPWDKISVWGAQISPWWDVSVNIKDYLRARLSNEALLWSWYATDTKSHICKVLFSVLHPPGSQRSHWIASRRLNDGPGSAWEWPLRFIRWLLSPASVFSQQSTSKMHMLVQRNQVSVKSSWHECRQR